MKRTLAAVIAGILIVAIIVSLTWYYYIAPSPAPTKEKILIGFSVPLTGAVAASAQECLMSNYLYWKDEVNAEGGIYVAEYGKKLPVEFIYYDDASDPGKTVEIYERLISVDHVDLLLPPWGTAWCYAALPVIEKYRYPMVSGLASAVKARSTPSEYGFWMGDVDAVYTQEVLFDFLNAHRDEIKTVAVLYVSSLFGLEHYEAFSELKVEHGFPEVVYVRDYPTEIKDFTPFISSIKSLNPDALLIFDYPADGSLFYRQALEQELRVKLYFSTLGATYYLFEQVFPPKEQKGVFMPTKLAPKMLSPEEKKWWDAFISRFGYHPCGADCVDARSTCQILQQAVEKAGTLDREKIREVLATESFQTVAGPLKFKKYEGGSCVAYRVDQKFTIFLGQRQGDGLWEVVWPPKIKTADPIFGWPQT